VLGVGYGVILRGKGFEVSILCKVILGFVEYSLGFSLEHYLCRA
jgi:hypothetical protein